MDILKAIQEKFETTSKHKDRPFSFEWVDETSETLWFRVRFPFIKNHQGKPFAASGTLAKEAFMKSPEENIEILVRDWDSIIDDALEDASTTLSDLSKFSDNEISLLLELRGKGTVWLPMVMTDNDRKLSAAVSSLRRRGYITSGEGTTFPSCVLTEKGRFLIGME